MVHLPQLWGVLYAPPNADGQRKACANCQHADPEVKKCEIVDAPIAPAMVCGYHVERGHQVSAELSGLETVDGGTSCDLCRFFYPLHLDGRGACAAVEGTEGGPAAVDAKGCCARWQAREIGR